jgi:hypothetical protein
MNIAIWPFFSQRDKRTGAIQVRTCGASKQMSFVAAELAKAGAHVKMAAPVHSDMWKGVKLVGITDVEEGNVRQRVHWDTYDMDEVFEGCDTALLNHETLAIPVRRLFPKMRIYQMCAVKPDDPLIRLAWKSADVVVVHTETMREEVHCEGVPYVTVWRMNYDESTLDTTPVAKVNDVVFVQRCSSTNYTHHVEFLAAMPSMPNVSVVFVDVTKYLRIQRPDLAYCQHEDYNATLLRSRVVVALNDDGFGGQAIREAIMCGCLPVAIDAPCYRELLSADWPYFVSRDFSDIAYVTARAVAEYDHVDLTKLRRHVAAESYQAAWPRIKGDLGL